MAITDHGNMFGAVEFYRKQGAGIKPIIGCEMYVAYGSRSTSRRRRPSADAGANNHLILLAANDDRYKNLCNLVSAGYTRASTTSRASTRSCFSEHSEGLIASRPA